MSSLQPEIWMAKRIQSSNRGDWENDNNGKKNMKVLSVM